MASTHRIKLTFTSTLPETGQPFVTDERLDITKDPEDGTFNARPLYLGSDGYVPGNMSYAGIGSLAAFRDDMRAQHEARAVSANKRLVEDRERNERIAAAAPTLKRILVAFGLTERDWETKVWTEVAAETGQALAEALQGCVFDVQIRKHLRPYMTAAKEDAREQYPEDYREEDEKEDFYETYSDEIAEHITQELS